MKRGKKKAGHGRERVASSLMQDAIRELAWFRYSLRKFLRFSESTAKSHGITSQQHQLLLGVAGFTGRRCATVSELAEFLQERHHSVVELVGRAARGGLVRKALDTRDRRFVQVSLTRKGEAILARLSRLHAAQLQQLRAGLLTISAPRHRQKSVAPSGKEGTRGPARRKNNRA